MHEPVIE